MLRRERDFLSGMPGQDKQIVNHLLKLLKKAKERKNLSRPRKAFQPPKVLVMCYIFPFPVIVEFTPLIIRSISHLPLSIALVVFHVTNITCSTLPFHPPISILLIIFPFPIIVEYTPLIIRSISQLPLPVIIAIFPVANILLP